MLLFHFHFISNSLLPYYGCITGWSGSFFWSLKWFVDQERDSGSKEWFSSWRVFLHFWVWKLWNIRTLVFLWTLEFSFFEFFWISEFSERFWLSFWLFGILMHIEYVDCCFYLLGNLEHACGVCRRTPAHILFHTWINWWQKVE